MPHNLYCCWDKMLHVTSKISKYCKIICIFFTNIWNIIFGTKGLKAKDYTQKNKGISQDLALRSGDLNQPATGYKVIV